MADSLDDFFAKRDKKKGSNKGKSQLTSEALVKELEEGSKLPDYPIRKDLKASALSSELLGLDADDADWRDFDDVDRKDYTGLKIQTISLEDQNEEELKRLQAERYEANLDPSGPWKKKDHTKASDINTEVVDAQPTSEDPTTGEDKKPQQPQQPPQQPQQEHQQQQQQLKQPSAEPSNSDTANDNDKSGDITSAKSTEAGKPQTEEPPATTKYVPPGAKRALSEQTKVLEPSKLPKRNRAQGQAADMPDLGDQMAFPSLG